MTRRREDPATSAAVHGPIAARRWIVRAAVVAAVLATSSVAAGAGVIDELSTSQAALAVPPGTTVASSVTGGADILGATRDLEIRRTSGSGTVSVEVAAGELAFAVAAATAGQLLATWDGDSDPGVLDPGGLGGVDLTTAGESAFRVIVESATAGAQLVLEVYSDADHHSRAGRVLPAIVATTAVLVDFSELLQPPGASGPADLTQVGAIVARVLVSDGSVVVSQIETAGPAVAAAQVDVTSGAVTPGETFTYRVTIQTTGGAAQGVDLTDLIDLHLVAGAVRTTPLARHDQYATFTDGTIDSAADGVPGLLANDGDPDGDALVVVATTGQSTAQGGSVDVGVDGHFVYTPPAGFAGVDAFDYTLQPTAGDPTTDASGNPIAPAQTTAFVTLERVPPVVTAGGTLAYTEDDPPTAIDATITVSDLDSTTLAGATAEISANYVLGEDVLSFTDMLGITGTWTPGTGTLTLSGSSSVTNYQTALRSVAYENASQAPSTLARTVTWIASDGVESSVPADSTITVASVNDAPVVTTTGGAAAFTEDGGAVVVDSSLTVSDGDDANLESAVVALTSAPDGSLETLAVSTPGANCPGLVITPGNPLTIAGSQAVATYQTCLRNVTYYNASQNPTTTDRTVQFVANDGDDDSDTATRTVTVTAVNDPPVAGADSWDTVGNTRLVVDLAPLATPHVRDTTASTFGVLDNDSDPAEGDAFSVTAIVGCADATPPFGDSPTCSTTHGGAVLMQANGRFTYTPPAGDNADDSFQYTVSDDGAPAPASANGTVTIHFFERVWYVANDAAAGGLGRSHDPFDTLAEAQTASLAGDWVFVHFGDGTSTGQAAGIVLKAGQHLLGEHHGLAIPQDLNGNGSPQTLLAAVPGNRPLVDASGGGVNAVAATDAIPVEIVGLSLQSTSANAVDLTLTGAFGGSGTLAVADNVVRGAGAEGIDVNSGGTGTLTLAITGNSWNTAGTHTGNGIDVARTAGTLRLDLGNNTNILSAATGVNVTGGAAASTTITGFANNAVHQNTGGSGIVVNNATFDGTPGAPYDPVSGGTTQVGVSGDGVGGAAMALGAVAGDLAFTDLDLFGAAGFALSGTGAVNAGAGSGTRVTVPAGMATFNATGGPAVSVSNATIDLQLAGMTSSGSATNGVSLTTVFDATSPAFPAVFSAPSGSSIAGATGAAFNLDGGNATITYGGTINNTAGRSVVVQNRTADTATFTGAITDTGTGTLLNANTGSAIGFTGTLALSTGSNAAFTATGGGTVTSTNTNSTLTTTTGTALNVTSTSIGGAGLTFKSISANGASKGIVLNNTGTGAGNGGLSVTGTGATNGSGGTIQSISTRGGEFITTKALSLKNVDFTNANTSDGGTCTDLSTAACNAVIYLSSVAGVTLDNIHVTGTTAQEGINGLNVSNFSLTNSTLANCGSSGATEEGCIKMRGLTGTCAITNSELSFPGADVVEIVNTAGPTLTLNVNGSTLRDSQSSSSGNTGLQARSEGTASMVLNVTNNNFLRIRTVGLHATAIDSASNDVDVTGNTFDPDTGTMIGVDLDADDTATLVFNVENNPKVYSRNGPAINVFGDVSATINGRINDNPDVQVKTNAGSNVGSGIRANINKDATARIEVKNNVVSIGSDDAGIDLSAIGRTSSNPGGATNTLDATVTGNNVTIGATSTYGIVILSATNAGDTNALCANVATDAITRDPSSIASFRARVPSASGFFRMQGFVTNPEATWNANGNTPTSSAGSEVSFGGSGTFAACTAVLPTHPGPN
jgi:Bacterial Ig domain/Bacterial cadherin-like domain